MGRLAVAAPNRWVLKGAFALDLRLGIRTRATKDIDLGRTDDEEAATIDLNAAAVVDLGDFFNFEVRRTSRLDRAVGFQATRYTVAAELAGRPFERFPVDVAFEKQSATPPEWLRPSDSLGFAGLDAPEIPVVALEQHVAEKLHAYTRTYGSERHDSTRTKDLIDLVLIGDLAALDGRRLRLALEDVFRLLDDLAAGHAEAAAFLNPALSETSIGRWDPRAKRWTQ